MLDEFYNIHPEMPEKERKEKEEQALKGYAGFMRERNYANVK